MAQISPPTVRPSTPDAFDPVTPMHKEENLELQPVAGTGFSATDRPIGYAKQKRASTVGLSVDRRSSTAGSQRGRSDSCTEKSLMKSAELIVSAQADARKSKIKERRFMIFGLLMALFLMLTCAANFGIIYFVVDKSVTTETQETGVANALVDKKDPTAIVKVAGAEENFMLSLAPALETPTLEHIKTLSVTLFGDTHEYLNQAVNASRLENMNSFAMFSSQTFNRTYTVTGFAHESDTMIAFFTSSGDKVIIEDGEAHVQASFGYSYPICVASATCASFKAKGINVEEVEAKAIAALKAKGVMDVMDEEAEAGRRLTLKPNMKKAGVSFTEEAIRRALSEASENRRELFYDFGCCSGGLATGGADGADCVAHPWKHETGAGHALSTACKGHDHCLGGCNGNCNCKGNCDSTLAWQGARASCWKFNSKWWGGYWSVSCACAALKPFLVAGMALRPNHWLRC